MSTLIRTSTSEGYTEALGRGVGRALRSGDVVRLVGDLGAGKTTLVRAVAAGLGVEPGMVSSPTYVIVNQYPTGSAAARERGIVEIVHADAYRLGSPEDLDSVGWDRLVEERSLAARAGSVMLVEWPERIAGALPPPERCGVITIRAIDEHSRGLAIAMPESWSARPEAALLIEREPVRCPITREWVEPTNPAYPFASERAKMADLGKWFGGGYRISRDAGPDELEGA